MSDKKLDDILEGKNFHFANRYLLFSSYGKNGYGGFKDLKFSTNILEDIKGRLPALISQVIAGDGWFHIVDIKTNKIIFDSEGLEDNVEGFMSQLIIDIFKKMEDL